jgi:glycosyltransferase involved in cell wall biosynthesis
MKKGVFVSCERKIDETVDRANGVLKKVYAQINALNIPNILSCEHIELPNTRMRYIFDLYKDTLKGVTGLDFVYIRRITPVDNRVISFLKRIKKNNPECKILYEIPTYPYDKEENKISLMIDKLYRLKLKRYVNKIVTLSNDDIIFNISTIKMVNGILFDNIPLKKNTKNSDKLDLIIVSNFAFYHGYDRLIEGLNDYYKVKREKKVYLHFIGGGIIYEKYKKLVKKYMLNEYCFFYGFLYEEELIDVYNKCNIAVCSLGLHRKGIYLSSELKSREYLARGLPIVTAAKIDIIPDGFRYCLKISEDESPVNIIEVVNFYDNLFSSVGEDMTQEIRQFAESSCEISKTMAPVIEYILRN